VFGERSAIPLTGRLYILVTSFQDRSQIANDQSPLVYLVLYDYVDLDLLTSCKVTVEELSLLVVMKDGYDEGVSQPDTMPCPS
jgi:hypothetical protein